MPDVSAGSAAAAPPGAARTRRRAAGVLGAVAGIGAVGAVLPAGGAGPVLCPFRLTTGLPCPFCGATRATVALVHGDVAGAATQNLVWPAVLAGVAVLAVATVIAPRLGPALARRAAGRRWVLPALVLLAVGWAWSLTHAATIAPPA